MMMRALLLLSLVTLTAGINLQHHEHREIPDGFAVVEEMTDDDPSEPNLAEVNESKSDSTPHEPMYDDSGLLIQSHDPSVDFGYVGEWSSQKKMKDISSDSSSLVSDISSASFLEKGTAAFSTAELVDDLASSTDRNEAFVSTMEATQPLSPFHQNYAAAMANYEQKFKEHFPEPPPLPYRFQEDFSKSSSAAAANQAAQPKFDTKDGEDYVWVPVPAKFLESFTTAAQAHANANNHANAASLLEVQSEVSQDPVVAGGNLEEEADGYLPFDALTPASLASQGATPTTAWDNMFGSPAYSGLNGAGAAAGAVVPPGVSYGGLYAGGLQAPPPPPRPDNLPPPPYIRPVPQPKAGAGEAPPARR